MGVLRSIQAKKNVFIIDDSPTYRELLNNEITKFEGVITHVFSSAEECFENDLPEPALVILDLYLDDGSGSVMSGHDALRQFLSLNENLEIVLVSAEVNETLLEEYKLYRGVDFILKSETISGEIKDVLEKKLFI